MKHWFKTAMQRINDEGVQYTMGTQMFYVDDDMTLASLADVFTNTGIGLGDGPVRVYIANNSVPMVHDGVRLPMAKVESVLGIVMNALARGFGKGVDVQDAAAYVMHLSNVLAVNARGAYEVEYQKLYGEAGEEKET